MPDTPAKVPGRRSTRRVNTPSNSDANQTRPELPTPEEPSPEIHDVWSRTAARYRVRAVVLLSVNVALYFGLCAFAYWLRTGVNFAPSQPHYWASFSQTFHTSRETTVSLGNFLTFPINVEEVPLQIGILGLLLAALVSIPILVSILYRFWACLPFLAGVAFLAMMPWLAITLTGSCILASVKPFRLQFRYASALVGLLLVLFYFYGAARTAAEPIASWPNPADRIKFLAPWLLATVASCSLMAFVLIIAKMVNYRPGAITPLLAINFALPMLLFEFYVGRDELHYRIIEHDFGPSSAYFAEQDVGDMFEAAVEIDWTSRQTPRPDFDVVRESNELWWSLQLDKTMGPINTAVVQHGLAATNKIDWFLRHYPQSRYAVNALYLKARALDMRVEQAALRNEKKIRFYDNFPGLASRRAWMMVVQNGPNSPMAAAALHRLALLDLQNGDARAAVEKLNTFIRRFSEPEPADPQQANQAPTGLGRAPADVTLGISMDRLQLEVRKLLAFIENNGDPLYGYEPLVEMMRADPKRVLYPANLENLKNKYPRAQSMDNIELALALTEPDALKRISSLEQCAANYPTGDAMPEILFRLGEAHRTLQDAAAARNYYDRVLTDYADSIWSAPAEDRVHLLAPLPAAAPAQTLP